MPEEQHPSKAEELVDVVLAKSSKKIKMKYNLDPSGMGATMPGGPIQSLTLCFDTKSELTKNDLRILLIKSAQELMNEVENNQEIQKFIKNKPFTIKNIQIIIYNHDQNGFQVHDPGISTAQISEGAIDYRTIDPQNTFNYKNEFEETYDEALKAMSSH